MVFNGKGLLLLSLQRFCTIEAQPAQGTTRRSQGATRPNHTNRCTPIKGQRTSSDCLAQQTHSHRSKVHRPGSKPLPALQSEDNHEMLTMAHSACPEVVSNQQKNVNLMLRILNQNLKSKRHAP